MSNFSKEERNHVIVLDQVKGVMVQNIINPEQLTTFIEDVTKRCTKVVEIAPIGSYHDVGMLALPRKTSKPATSLISPWTPKTSQLNFLATNLMHPGKKRLIYGDTYIFHKSEDGSFEYLTKGEALDIAQEIRG